MGNSSSSTRRPRNSAGVSSRAVVEPDAEPVISEAKVDQVFEAMKDAFDRTLQELNDAEKDLLLRKLCSKLQEEYPSVMMAATIMEGVGVASSSASPRKKRKHSKDTSIIIQKWAIPLELLLNVARFLPRECLNNLKLTCKPVLQCIENPELLTQPWGLTCPFQFPPPDETDCPLGCVIFSNDGSRVAVFTEGTSTVEDDEEVPGTLQVWDRHKGLLGELLCSPVMCLKPVFSPNNEFLLLEPRNSNDTGILVCQLPSGNLQVPIVVSSHDLQRVHVSSVAFLDNTTIAFMELYTSGVKTCNITRVGNQITLSEPTPMTLVDPDPSGWPFRRGLWECQLASFSSANKDILACVLDSFDRRTVIFYDRRSNTSVARSIPTGFTWVCNLAFSQDGNRLVVAHNEGGLSVFDCNVDTIAHIGEPRVISLDGTYYGNISFSPSGALKVAVSYGDKNDVTRIRIIDIENGQILCDGWNDSSWKMLVSC